MFFIMGVTSRKEKLNFLQNIICKNCGKYGRYEIFISYSLLTIFFIPIFKFAKKYYVKSSCCNTVYQISKELGNKIYKGEITQIEESDLVIINTYNNYSNICPNCGCQLNGNFNYCPNCGAKNNS